MNFLNFFHRYSFRRSAWLLLTMSALLLEVSALYFQHQMSLQPCVLCIYQRCALFGILAAGLLGLIAPFNKLIRYLAIFLWIYSAWQGFQLAWKHTMMIVAPSPIYTCDFLVSFPHWLPLDKWFPAIFNATGDCSVTKWNFLSLGMPQWLLGIFSAYLLVAFLILISQPFNKPSRPRLFKR